MDRFPIIITLGGMLLGWIAGTMAVTDPALAGWVVPSDAVKYGAAVAGALFVLAVGSYLTRRSRARAGAAGRVETR
jgi:predicted tellurium resistance membrane protein TerC